MLYALCSQTTECSHRVFIVQMGLEFSYIICYVQRSNRAELLAAVCVSLPCCKSVLILVVQSHYFTVCSIVSPVSVH